MANYHLKLLNILAKISHKINHKKLLSKKKKFKKLTVNKI
jgi:hypothetical protein